MNTETRKMAFGLNAALPEGVEAAWGARLIFPDDLLWDRQGTIRDDDSSAWLELQAWLDGKPRGKGALKAALDRARALADSGELCSSGTEQVTLYEDADGTIVGNPNGSYGYLYVAAWLHRHVPKGA
jgi:hypothetical protein